MSISIDFGSSKSKKKKTKTRAKENKEKIATFKKRSEKGKLKDDLDEQMKDVFTKENT